MRRAGVLVGLCATTLLFPQQKPAAPPSELDKAVEEFRVQTRELGLRADSPPRGPSDKGTKSQWHGRLFENLRNDVFDAVPHEIVQRGGTKNVLRRNQFGFNLSGPVLIPKLYKGGRATFFSVSYEGMRERISRTYLRTIPTTPERTGDYSAVVDQAGEILPIYDPKTTSNNPGFDSAQPVSRENLQYNRLPFPGNRIPDSRLDPVSRKAVAYYPQPNANAGPFFRNNYFINDPESNTANGMIGKVDHSIRERHRLTVEIGFSNGYLKAAQWFPNGANPGPTDRDYTNRRGSLEHVFTASSRTVNRLSFSASTDTSTTSTGGEGERFAEELGLAGVGQSSFPYFYFTSTPYLSMGQSYPASRNASNNFVWTESLSVKAGRHSTSMVAQYIRYQVNSYWPQYPSGSFRFGPGLTSLPGIVDTGHPFASFLLGLSDFSENTLVTSPSYLRKQYFLAALRDQYEVRTGLTISAGVNIIRHVPRTEKWDRQSTVDLATVNPANGRLGALVAAARGGFGRAFQPVLYRVDPSASIAWNPKGNSKTVIRASFGRSYSAYPLYSGQWGTQGFNAYPTYLSSNIQLEPAILLVNGLPPYNRPLPDLRPESANDTVADLMDVSTRVPTYQSASLSVEREIPGSMVVTASASYSGGKNLYVGGGAANLNAIHPDDLVYRDQLYDLEFNKSRRPYPQYRMFDIYSSHPGGRYFRDEVNLRLEKRTSQGMSFSTFYEYSKQWDDYSGPYGKQDYFHRENEWSLTPGNPAHRFRVTYMYELPFGANKPLLNYTDWRRHALAGWQVSGTASLYGGDPMYFRPQYNNTGGVLQSVRVNVVPGVDPRLPNPTPEMWYNPLAFDQPADFTLGNASRTHPYMRNPASQYYDLSCSKRLALGTDRTLEFTAASFNFLNKANWTDPDVTIGPASAPNVNAGKIIGSRGGRVVQLGLRLSF